MVKVRVAVVPSRGARKSGSRSRKPPVRADERRTTHLKLPEPARSPEYVTPVTSPVYRPIAKPASLTTGPYALESGEKAPPAGPLMELHWDDEPPQKAEESVP